MSKIRILAIPSDKHGVGKFRMMDPFVFISDKHSEDIHVDISYNAEDRDDYFLNYDIVVFHTFIHQTNHEHNIKRINWLKSKGIITIMDIDDLWFVDQRHPMYMAIKMNKVGEMKMDMLKSVDYVTTTTPIFAQTIKDRLKINNVAIFPNAVNEDEPQFQNKPVQSDKVRFGWLGGSSHLHDLELMSNGISSTYNLFKDKVQFVLCGFDTRGSVTVIDQEGKQQQRPIQPTETVWYKYEGFFTDDFKVLSSEYKNYLGTFTQGDYNDIDEPYRRRWTKDINSYATNSRSSVFPSIVLLLTIPETRFLAFANRCLYFVSNTCLDNINSPRTTMLFSVGNSNTDNKWETSCPIVPSPRVYRWHLPSLHTYNPLTPSNLQDTKYGS